MMRNSLAKLITKYFHNSTQNWRKQCVQAAEILVTPASYFHNRIKLTIKFYDLKRITPTRNLVLIFPPKQYPTLLNKFTISLNLAWHSLVPAYFLFKPLYSFQKPQGYNLLLSYVNTCLPCCTVALSQDSLQY